MSSPSSVCGERLRFLCGGGGGDSDRLSDRGRFLAGTLALALLDERSAALDDALGILALDKDDLKGMGRSEPDFGALADFRVACVEPVGLLTDLSGVGLGATELFFIDAVEEEAPWLPSINSLTIKIVLHRQ